MKTTPVRRQAASPSLQGVFAALVSPMKRDHQLDLDRLGTFVEHLIQSGVHGLVPLGSTGEYYALQPKERAEVLRTTLRAAAGRVPVIAGTNAGSTADVIQYSRQAEALGAAGVMLAPPYYSLPTPDELLAHFRAVNNQLGIPIMLYNYPGRTGVDMSPDLILRLTELQNVRYVKESTGDMARMTTLIRRGGDRLRVFCGCDTLALESFAIGTVGWVGGVVNVLPKSHVALHSLAVAGNWATARELFYSMLPTLELMEGGGKYTQFVKAACGLKRRPVGGPRPPLRPPTAHELLELKAALRLVNET